MMKNFLVLLCCSVFILFSTSAEVGALSPDDVKLSPDDVKLPIDLSLEMPFGEYLKGLSPDDVKQGGEDQVGLSPDDVKRELSELLEQVTYEKENAYFLQENPGELLLVMAESSDGEEHILSVIEGREVVSESTVRLLLAAYMNLVELNPELNGFPVVEIALNSDLEGSVLDALLSIATYVRIDVTK